MSYLEVPDFKSITTLDQLFEYARANYGVVITWRDKSRFHQLHKEFQKDNPHVDISVLAKAVHWGKMSGKKLRHLAGIFLLAEAAFAAGALPELDPVHLAAKQLDDEIYAALRQESDFYWRSRLMAAAGPARASVLAEWQLHRQQLTLAV